MATVNLIGDVIKGTRTLKRYGPAHTELAKKNMNLRDHDMWDFYYNPSFGKWLPKQKVFTYHGKKYKGKQEYISAIESGDVNMPEGKVIKDKTGNLVDKPKRGYVRNNILYASKAKADEAEAKKLDEETQQFFRNVPVDNEVAVRLSDIKPKQSLAHRKFNVNIRSIDTVQHFLSTKVMNEVKQIFDTNGSIILKIMYQLTAIKPMKKEEDTRSTYTTWTEKMLVLSQADITNLRNDLGTQFANSVETLPTRGSGLTFKSLDEVNVYATRYTPPAGSSYIPLPDWLKNKGCCINVQNTDNKCFAWAVLSALYPATKDAQRVSKYADKLDTLNFAGISFPVNVEQFKKFEMQNDVAINVFGVEGRQACLIYSSKKPKNSAKVVNILKYNDHYCWIKNFNRFMNNGTDHQMFHCESCSIGFYTEALLAKHVANGGCSPQFVSMPEEGSTVKFKNTKFELACPLVIYGDFESMLKPTSIKTEKTEVVQEHKANAYACMIVSRDDPSMNNFQMEVVEDAGKKFIDYLRENASTYYDFIHQNKKVDMTAEEKHHYDTATHCHICKIPLYGDKVWDHNHITGKYRGPAHDECNLHYALADYVPVLFHNLTGYDGQFIFDALSRYEDFRPQISAIPISGEKFKSITISVYAGHRYNEKKKKQVAVYLKYKFIDSAGFMNASLSKLADSLPDEHKHITRKNFSDPVQFATMKKKGFFPYDVVKSMDDLHATCLPAFESLKPTIGKIDKQDYDDGCEAWKVFNCKTLGDYLKIYLTADVMLLADIFEKFRGMCIEYYKLDPVHYVSLPAMAWDACLKMTGVELGLISNYDDFLMLEAGKRGGSSFISHRYAKANNPYMNDYDPSKETSYLSYFDANNLYGWAMVEPLPTGNYGCIDKSLDELLVADPYGKEGYEVECDLEYPEELHDSHAMYPLAPVTKKVDQSELSEFQQSFGVLNSTAKLMTTLEKKEKYVLHYRNLQLYVSLGMKCTKIHRVMRFDQSPWLAKYIELNTKKRAEVKSDFEKDLFKLMNNAVFGKTMENVRDRIKIEFLNANDDKRIQKIAGKPTYTGQYQECNGLVGMKMNQRSVKLNKPIGVGVAILELSKVHMYNFHYNTMLPRYGHKNLQLILTDTDSLFYHIKTKDVYADLREMRDLFDLSAYPKDHPNYDPKNNKVLGKFKDEEADDIITEVVGLRSKLYAYKVQRGDESKKRDDGYAGHEKETKKCKGVKKYVVEDMQFAQFKNTLDSLEDYQATMTGIRSKDHQLQTVTIKKTALSAYDDKRYYLDNINSVPYGHHSIRK